MKNMDIFFISRKCYNKIILLNEREMMEVIAKKIGENQYVVTERYWLKKNNIYGAFVSQVEMDAIFLKCEEEKKECIIMDENDVCMRSCYPGKNKAKIFLNTIFFGFGFAVFNYIILQTAIYVLLSYLLPFDAKILAGFCGFSMHLLVSIYLPLCLQYVSDLKAKKTAFNFSEDVVLENSLIEYRCNEGEEKVTCHEQWEITPREIKKAKNNLSGIIITGLMGVLSKSFIIFLVVFAATPVITEYGRKKFEYKAIKERQIGTIIKLGKRV